MRDWAEEARRQGASVTIETVDRQKVTNTVLVPKGAGCLGIDWAEIEVKYRALAPNAPMSGERRPGRELIVN